MWETYASATWAAIVCGLVLSIQQHVSATWTARSATQQIGCVLTCWWLTEGRRLERKSGQVKTTRSSSAICILMLSTLSQRPSSLYTHALHSAHPVSAYRRKKLPVVMGASRTGPAYGSVFQDQTTLHSASSFKLDRFPKSGHKSLQRGFRELYSNVRST